MIKQYDVWVADLNPRNGTEPGKTRPVVIIQTDLLNVTEHPSTIICPITSNVNPDIEILRVGISTGQSGLEKNSHVLIDQIRAIDNKRLIERIGTLSAETIDKIKQNIKIVLDLD